MQCAPAERATGNAAREAVGKRRRPRTTCKSHDGAFVPQNSPSIRPILHPHCRSMPAIPSPSNAASRPMAPWTEGLPLADLAADFGTPVYLHPPQTLERAFMAYAAMVGPAVHGSAQVSAPIA
jgi:hypothetical protein